MQSGFFIFSPMLFCLNFYCTYAAATVSSLLVWRWFSLQTLVSLPHWRHWQMEQEEEECNKKMELKTRPHYVSSSYLHEQIEIDTYKIMHIIKKISKIFSVSS